MAVPDRLLIHDVVIVTPARASDAYGNVRFDYGAAAARVTVRGWMQQDTRQLVALDGGSPMVATWLLVTNHTGIDRRAHVEWADITFELDGQPEPTYAMGGLHHSELTLRIVDG